MTKHPLTDFIKRLEAQRDEATEAANRCVEAHERALEQRDAARAEHSRFDIVLRHILYYARLDLRSPDLALARIDETASQVLAYAEPLDPVADRAERMQPLVAAALHLYATLNDPMLRQDRLAVREALDSFNEAVEHYQQQEQR